jgi:hypothetical protein
MIRQVMMPMNILGLAFALTTTLISTSAPSTRQATTSDWKELLAKELPTMGHRNWLIVADSAYPEQVSPGVVTIYTGEPQMQLLSEVMAMVKQQKHVTPVIFEDTELGFLNDQLAPGVDQYKMDLGRALGGAQPQTMLHEKMIGNLDQVGKTFRVIILKSTLTIPYTSVFMRLDCGYWGDEGEKKLRAKMGSAGAAMLRHAGPRIVTLSRPSGAKQGGFN